MQKSKILAFLLALVVSIVLWFYAVTVVNPDDTITISGISVQFEGTEALTSQGLMLTGGGALLRDLDQLLKEETGLPVHVAEEPLNCVVKGCGIALENMDKLHTAFAVG